MTRTAPYFRTLGAVLLCHAVMVSAQNTLDNPDWVELAVPPAPAYSRTGLIPITMPTYLSIQIGVDPATVETGMDGIVRYVVVMTNATGTSNASYEGIRCLTDEVKTYARMGSSGQWSSVTNPQWKPVNDNMPSRHAYAIARQGACDARVAPRAAEVLKALRLNENRFKPNSRL